jgi:hypothetical protein
VRQQDRFFPRQLESLLGDLDFHRLAAQEPLQLAYTLFQAADLGSHNDFILFAHQPLQRNTRLGLSLLGSSVGPPAVASVGQQGALHSRGGFRSS